MMVFVGLELASNGFRMKINISIKADSNVSLYCGGWIIEDTRPLQVKLGNPAIAGLITGCLPCHIEIPGKVTLAGSIQRSDKDDTFIINQ